jgi:hypothetical protein
MAKLIGNKPNQVPTNGDLGTMAYQDYDVVAPQFLAGGRRNLIINGAMQVAQRGTSETGVTSNGYYAVDRMRIGIANAGTWTISKDSDAPDGFGSSLKWQCTTASASLVSGAIAGINYKFEGQDLCQLDYGSPSAKTVTLSFRVKSNKTGTYIVSVYQDDGGKGISQSYSIDSADTWETKTITFVGNTASSINNDNSTGLQIWINLVAGSDFTSGTLSTSWATYSSADSRVGQVNLADSTSNYFAITGVQLEVGSVATPFEHRSYGEELALCQRYYAKMIAGESGGGFGTGMFSSSTNAQIVIKLPKTMRTNPSVSFSNLAVNDASSNISVTGAGTLYDGNSSLRQDFTVASGGTQYRPAMLQATGAGSFVAFDAEL